MRKTGFAVIALLLSGAACAASSEVTLNAINSEGIGKPAGTITITETAYGLLFTPSLQGLPAGIHGFHIHEQGNCGPAQKDGHAVAGLAAGGHYDPQNTGKHQGPYGEGHLGDLPALYVLASGEAVYPVLAPRLHRLDEIRGKALMIHAGGDNHSDNPAPLGGGGARLFCGVIH